MRTAVHDRQIANLDDQLCIISSPIPRPSTPPHTNFPTSPPWSGSFGLFNDKPTHCPPASIPHERDGWGEKESVDRRRASASVHLPYCKASPSVRP